MPAFVLALAYWDPTKDYCRKAALAIFLTACLTDALDGWIARRLHQKTRLGSLIDPLADKILLTSAYLALAWLPGVPDSSRLPVWLTVLVISRDLILVTGAATIFMMQNRFDPHTNYLGKVTTVFQMILVIAALAGISGSPLQILVVGTAVATALSGAVYLKLGAAQLNATR